MSWQGKQVLVTGAGGFIGSHLVQALLERGEKVRALLRYNSDGGIGNLQFLPADVLAEVHLVHGDLIDAEFVFRLVANCDTILHLGALVAIPYSYSAPRSYVTANIDALRRTWQLEIGVLEVDAQGRLIQMREKPVTEHLMSMGIYLLKREAVRPFLEPGRAMDMPDLQRAMVSGGIMVDTYISSGNWLDIGTPEDYAQAQSFVAGGLDRLLPGRQ